MFGCGWCMERTELADMVIGNFRRDYHIVVLGAGGVGKSCLTAQFVQNIWIESYDPTIEDSYRKMIEVDVSLLGFLSSKNGWERGWEICANAASWVNRDDNACWRCEIYLAFLLVEGVNTDMQINRLDTAGTEQFTAMRELYMKTGQGFLLVFSITSQSSLNELSELRETIIRIKDDDNVPIVIVGNKSDLEQDRMVSRQTAFNVSQSWGNAPYYETSARRRANVDEVFIDLCRQIIRRDNNRSTPEFEDEIHPPVDKKHHRIRRLGRCVIL
ncbi:hypothetical protein DSL72_009176 [Monilinia vaccinii-corymbosi]|uniref:Ras-related protein RSR1 n=1 Tax=Monilinia vaccinii-corymbosi TaxID=61207 RepID=A0A8A3PQB3_9HELO|nr:hypothetical protein DSL72_009176 [Monilinia vaccinii-corymbosi]